MKSSKYFLLIVMSIFMSQSPVDDSSTIKPFLCKPFTPLKDTDTVSIPLVPRELLVNGLHSESISESISVCSVPNSEQELSKFVQEHCSDGKYVACYLPGVKQDSEWVFKRLKHNTVPNQILMFIDQKLVQVFPHNKFLDSSFSNAVKSSRWSNLLLNEKYLTEPKIDLISNQILGSSGSMAIVESKIHILQTKIDNDQPFTVPIALVNTIDLQRGLIPKEKISEINGLSELSAALKSTKKDEWIALYFPSKGQNYSIRALYTNEGFKTGYPAKLAELFLPNNVKKYYRSDLNDPEYGITDYSKYFALVPQDVMESGFIIPSDFLLHRVKSEQDFISLFEGGSQQSVCAVLVNSPKHKHVFQITCIAYVDRNRCPKLISLPYTSKEDKSAQMASFLEENPYIWLPSVNPEAYIVENNMHLASTAVCHYAQTLEYWTEALLYWNEVYWHAVSTQQNWPQNRSYSHNFNR